MSEKVSKESQYIVSHPELGSDPPFGSDRESGRDKAYAITFSCCINTHPKPCLEASQYTVYPSCPDGSVRTGAEVNFRFSSSKLC